MNEHTEIKNSVLLDALDKRWNDYYAELKLCRRETSKEVIHDLRVATRRLLSVIELLRAIAPQPRLQRLRKLLKDQLERFEELRDIQVMVVEVSENLKELPEAAPFLAYLQKQEKKFLRTAKRQVAVLKPGNLIKRISTIRKSVVRLSDGSDDINSSLLETVDDAFGLVLHRSGMLDQSRTASIHRLRIAFRQFRYLVEIIHPALPSYPRDELGALHEFQGTMGDIQDIEILLNILAEFSEKEPSYDLEPVHRYFQQRHSEAVHLFFQGAARVKTFWRSSRTAPFPWNRKPRRPKSTWKPPASRQEDDARGGETGDQSVLPSTLQGSVS